MKSVQSHAPSPMCVLDKVHSVPRAPTQFALLKIDVDLYGVGARPLAQMAWISVTEKNRAAAHLLWSQPRCGDC